MLHAIDWEVVVEDEVVAVLYRYLLQIDVINNQGLVKGYMLVLVVGDVDVQCQIIL